MVLPVVTVASGGLAVVDVSAIAPMSGLPVSEAANLRGLAVTKVVGKPGLPVVYTTIGGGVAPLVPATLDGVATNVTLSGGNLIATHSNSSTNSGARSTALKTTGKLYFEVTIGAVHGNNDAVGVVPAATSYATMIGGFGGPIVFYGGSGLIFFNGTNTGKTIGSWVAGDVIGAAINLDNGKSWFRRNNDNWNGDATANPATGVGYVGPGAGGGSPAAPTLTFGGVGTAAGDSMTLNCGQAAFAFPQPSGFTAGWPA